VRLVQHHGQVGNVFPVGPFALLPGLTFLLGYLLGLPELFAEQVNEHVRIRLQTVVSGRLRTLATRCLRTFVSPVRDVSVVSFILSLRVHLSTVRRRLPCVCRRLGTVFESVHERRCTDKFGAVDQAVCRGAERALVDELIEG